MEYRLFIALFLNKRKIFVVDQNFFFLNKSLAQIFSQAVILIHHTSFF